MKLSVLCLLILVSCACLINRPSESAEQPANIEPPKRGPIAPPNPAEPSSPRDERQDKDKAAAEEAARKEKPDAEELKYRRETEEKNAQIQETIAAFTGRLVTIGFLQVAVAVIALGGIWVSWRAAKAANLSAETAERQGNTLVAIERPWLIATLQEVTGWPLPLRDTPCNFRVVWKVENVGKSPAFVNLLSHRIEVLDCPITGEPRYDDAEINQMVIPPGGDYLTATKKTIAADDVLAVKAGSKRVVFFGLISYESRLGIAKTHDSNFGEYWFYEDGRAEEPKIGPDGWVRYT